MEKWLWQTCVKCRVTTNLQFVNVLSAKHNKTKYESESRSVVSDSPRSHGLFSPWNSPGQNTGVGSHSLLQGISPCISGTEPRSPALQTDSLPAEPQGKPRNTGVGSLSLLQQIFQTQESNWGLLHCRQILYQLSYEGSLTLIIKVHKCLWANWT